MKKTSMLLALLASAALAGSALAQEHCDHAGGPHGDGAKIAAFHARHQARLHDKLKLSAEQESAWKTFIEKTKPDLARHQAVHEEMAKLTTPERMDRMQALMKEGEERMAARAAAVKEFYAKLSPEQQKTFDDQAKAWHDRGPGRRGPRPSKEAPAAPAK